MTPEIGQEIATKATYVAGGAAVLAGLNVMEWAAVGGFALALITFFVNVYYRRKADKRDEARTIDACEYQKRMGGQDVTED